LDALLFRGHLIATMGGMRHSGPDEQLHRSTAKIKKCDSHNEKAGKGDDEADEVSLPCLR